MSEPVTASADSLHTLMRQRYGMVPDGLADAPVNDVIASLLQHRSVRAFASRPLPTDILQIIMAAAQSASTSSNLQAWSVVAVQDPLRRERLATCAGNQKHVANAPLLLVFIADLSRLRRVSDAGGMPGDGLDYLETFVVATVDAALAAQNAVVALESLGLGCCYIGGMRNQPEAVAAELGLPEEAFAVFGLTVGWPADEVETDVKPRLPAPLVMHLEQYREETKTEVAAYDDTMKTFQASQAMQQVGWAGQASRRVRGPEALSGRDRLVEALKGLGFGVK